NQAQGQFQLRHGTIGFRHKPGCVVIADKRDQSFRVGVKRILAENRGQFRHGLAMGQNVAQSEVDWKVEWRVEPAVDTGVADSSGKKRSNLSISIEDFPYCGQVR